MELVLDRKVRSVKSTTGELFVDGVFQCFTLEDVDRGLKSTMSLEEILERKLKGDTCIPEGRYQVIITNSPEFGCEMPLIVNVKGYTGIRIHWGNTEKDTEGCPLVGEGRTVDFVSNSRVAYNKLLPKIKSAIGKGQKVYITIQ